MDNRDNLLSRAIDAIQFANETIAVEFKREASFETLRYKIAKTAMGMANLQDGGLIIIGMTRNQDLHYVAQGVSTETEATYSAEKIFEFVNSFASPTIDLRTISLDFNGARLICIGVPPFERTPVVCRKSTPDNTPKADVIERCRVYVRRASPTVQSVAADDSAMLEDLLRIAAGKRAGEIFRELAVGGINPAALAGVSEYDKEVEDIADYF